MTYRVCVTRQYLCHTGQTFQSWVADSSINIFIGPNQHKYSRGSLEDSKWDPTHIFEQHEKKSYFSKLFFYEKYIQENLMHEILSLLGMRLGCFCQPTQICHGDILLRLIQEEMQQVEVEFEKAETPKMSTPLQPLIITTPKVKNPPAKRRLFDESDEETDENDARRRRNFYLENS